MSITKEGLRRGFEGFRRFLGGAVFMPIEEWGQLQGALSYLDTMNGYRKEESPMIDPGHQEHSHIHLIGREQVLAEARHILERSGLGKRLSVEQDEEGKHILSPSHPGRVLSVTAIGEGESTVGVRISIKRK